MINILFLGGTFSAGIIMLSLGGAITLILVFFLIGCLCGRRQKGRNPTLDVNHPQNRMIILRGSPYGPQVSINMMRDRSLIIWRGGLQNGRGRAIQVLPLQQRGEVVVTLQGGNKNVLPHVLEALAMLKGA